MIAVITIEKYLIHKKILDGCQSYPLLLFSFSDSGNKKTVNGQLMSALSVSMLERVDCIAFIRELSLDSYV